MLMVASIEYLDSIITNMRRIH